MKPAWKSTLQLTTAIIFTTGTLTNFASADAMSELVAAAKEEGTLTTIALPHDWCGYGEVIEGFKAKYGLEVNELNPDAGSGDEIEAIKANKGNTGPQAPDVIDVGLSFGPSAKAEGLIQPYKVATWDTIPDSAKDAEGYWYGDYYGVLAFEVNTDIVKNVAAGLGRPAEAPTTPTAVALAGDPRASNQAIQAVYAAGLSAGGRRCRQGRRGRPEVLRRAQQGRQLRAGDRQGGAAGAGLDADHHPLGLQRACPTATRSTATRRSRSWCPKTGVVAGVYVQAISAYAPHPNAAKLWMEYLYSDEGQLGLAQGLLPPDPLQRPGQERQGPAGAAGQAAAGGRLRGGGVPDARRAGRRPRR